MIRIAANGNLLSFASHVAGRGIAGSMLAALMASGAFLASPQAFAQAAPELRANFSANYHLNQHNLRLGVNYVSAVSDERPGVQYGENGKDWVTADFAYRFELNDSLSFTAVVNNMFDQDPPPAQEELGYDPWVANPLGRVIEIGFKDQF